MTGVLTLTVCTDGDGGSADAEDIVRGLRASPRTLDPRFLYHRDGAGLFDEITRLDEYYPTRTEQSLLERFGAGIARGVRPREIVELGPGNGAKSGTLIGPALRVGTLERYVPLDVSESAVREGAATLLAAHPDLGEIAAVVGDFGRHLSAVPSARGTRLVAFLGSTIGNLHPHEQRRFLHDVRALIPGSAGALLVGVDLVKDVRVIEAAYNDARGVTASFNRNALHAVNDLLGTDVDPDLFAHRAFFNAAHSRIEMHLEARADVSFALPPSGETIRIRAGETIWTESSYKFTRDGFARTLREAGFDDVIWHADPDDLFALALARPG